MSLNTKRLFQFFALILAVAGLVASAWLLTQKNSPLYQPIKNYELVAPLEQLTNEQVHKVIKPYLGNSFWDIPLDNIQAELVRLDWAKSAQVKRKWPNKLFVSIQEQKPVARWNSDGLINGSGEVFFPQKLTQFDDYVLLQGQLENSGLILKQLIWLQKQFENLDMLIANLAFNDNVWRITVLGGPEIIVDNEQFENKTQRFVRAYPKLDKTLRKSAQTYDLRYSNGFIVSD